MLQSLCKVKRQLTVFIIAGSIIVSGCSRDKIDDNKPSLPPVETGNANTSYAPAFAGQTRIGAVATATPIKKTIVTESLDAPWGITSLPDGRLLITEKDGRLRIVTSSGDIGDPIQGVLAVDPAGQGGLLGLCLDPDFANNKMIYWVFSEPGAEGNLTAVAKGRLSDDETKLEDPTVIYRATPAYRGSLHYGGRILFDKNGNLLVSTGERSDLSTRPQAQSMSSSLGKIVRITKDGAPAKGNPFDGESEARPELYTIGHRNPQGLAFHPETGDLWANEHGPRGGDELNRIQAGFNYGWPTITYGIEYSGQPIGDAIQQKDGMEQPVYYWDPVISPSGMTFYNSNHIAEWRNNLFIGSLSGKHIARLVIEDNKVTGEERLLAGEGQRFRDVTVATNGSLYAITDDGRLYHLDKE